MLSSVNIKEYGSPSFDSSVKAAVDGVGIIVLDEAIDPGLASFIHARIRSWGKEYASRSVGLWHQRGPTLQKTMQQTESPFVRCEVKRIGGDSFDETLIDSLISAAYGQMDVATSKVLDAIVCEFGEIIEPRNSGLSLLAYQRPDTATESWGDLAGHVDGHNIMTCHAMASDASYWADLKTGRQHISLRPDQLMISFGSHAKDYGFEPVHHGITISQETEYREAIVAFYQ